MADRQVIEAFDLRHEDGVVKLGSIGDDVSQPVDAVTARRCASQLSSSAGDVDDAFPPKTLIPHAKYPAATAVRREVTRDRRERDAYLVVVDGCVVAIASPDGVLRAAGGRESPHGANAAPVFR